MRDCEGEGGRCAQSISVELDASKSFDSGTVGVEESSHEDVEESSSSLLYESVVLSGW